MLKVEVVGRTYYTRTFTDEEEKKIIEYIKDNLEEFEYMSDKNKILNAVEALWENDELDLYEDIEESDYETEEVKWSSFEHRCPTDILEDIWD